MRKLFLSSLFGAGLAIAASAGAASAAPLRVVNVDASSVLCVFNATCLVTATDTTGLYPPATGYSGHPKLITRTFEGAPGSQAEGLTAYLYRVDFSKAHAETDVNCAINLRIKVPGLTRLKYDGETRADVFVVSTGGAGDVGISSADRVGSTVTLTFTSEVCPNGGFTANRSSFFIGMASSFAPFPYYAKSDLTFGGGTVKVKARVPVPPS